MNRQLQTAGSVISSTFGKKTGLRSSVRLNGITSTFGSDVGHCKSQLVSAQAREFVYLGLRRHLGRGSANRLVDPKMGDELDEM